MTNARPSIYREIRKTLELLVEEKCQIRLEVKDPPRIVKSINSIRRIDNVISSQLISRTFLRTNSSTARSRADPSWGSDAVSGRLLETLLLNHVDLIWQSNNDILVTSKLEVIGLDLFCVSLDSVGIFSASEDLLHVPGDDERTRSCDDRCFIDTFTSVEACSGE